VGVIIGMWEEKEMHLLKLQTFSWVR